MFSNFAARHKTHSCQLLMLAGILLLSGCGWFGSKKVVIDDAIKALQSRRGEMIALNKDIETVDFYADESGSGVVIDYKYKKTAKISAEFNSEAAKKLLIAQFKDNEGMKTILGYDVFVRFLFKDGTGNTIADVKLEKNDL
ncbi:MAG: hypothetical protein AAFN77_12390 [Planctomycetota bacterium]